DRAAGVPGREGDRLPAGTGRWGPVGDGTGVRRAASAMREHAGPPRAAARTTKGSAANLVRPRSGRGAGPVPGRTGRPGPAVGGSRGAAADLPDRRPAVAGSRVGAG